MELVQKIDSYGKPAWIAVMVIGFILFWPVGLAILGYLIWSGRMGCGQSAPGRWYNKRDGDTAGQWWKGNNARRSSGNRAFDEYRQETLDRLEREHDEFVEFLDNLRHARDKAEFDQFMAARRAAADADEAPESGKDAKSGMGEKSA